MPNIPTFSTTDSDSDLGSYLTPAPVFQFFQFQLPNPTPELEKCRIFPDSNSALRLESTALETCRFLPISDRLTVPQYSAPRVNIDKFFMLAHACGTGLASEAH